MKPITYYVVTTFDEFEVEADSWDEAIAEVESRGLLEDEEILECNIM